MNERIFTLREKYDISSVNNSYQPTCTQWDVFPTPSYSWHFLIFINIIYDWPHVGTSILYSMRVLPYLLFIYENKVLNKI